MLPIMRHYILSSASSTGVVPPRNTQVSHEVPTLFSVFFLLMNRLPGFAG